MLAPKFDKKKIMEYSAVLGVIFAIIIYIILTNFVFKGEKTEETSGSSTTEVSPIKKDVDIENFDSSLIEDKKFKNLKENKIKDKSLSELEVGNENPFKTKD